MTTEDILKIHSRRCLAALLADAAMTDQARIDIARHVVSVMADCDYDTLDGAHRAMPPKFSDVIEVWVNGEDPDEPNPEALAIKILDDCAASSRNVGGYSDDAHTTYWRRWNALHGGAQPTVLGLHPADVCMGCSADRIDEKCPNTECTWGKT